MVDDDQDDREIFHEAILKVYPAVQLMFARDGEEALNILSGSDLVPDVIFLDHNMPRVTGIQCLKTLKADPKTRTIPIVMYTTSGDREEEKLALFLGADYYMRKTASFEQLCNEIRRLLYLVEKQKRHPGELSD